MLKKASKRLMTAIISLVVSVILCVGVCLAWFAVNNKVGGDGMNFQLRPDDLINFTVNLYYLNKTSDESTVPATYDITSDGNVGGTVDKDNDGVIDVVKDGNGKINVEQTDAMRPFSLSGEYTTAVLFKLEYEIAADSPKWFRIFTECPCPLPETIPATKPAEGSTTRLAVVNDGNVAFKSNLSNTVTFTKASATVGENGVPTACSEDQVEGSVTHTPFVDQNHEKSFKLPFFDGINVKNAKDNEVVNGVYKNASYLIMDYDSERFTYLSSLMLESGGSLSSNLSLIGDINFVMEEYKLDELAVTVKSVALDTLASNAVYEQNATKENNDIMSKTWQFVVTYSDGGKKIVKANVVHNELDITGVDTTALGAGTATVTYPKNSSDAKTCSVNYTINLAISGNTCVALENTLTLKLVGAPAGATVAWSSDNETVATVENGVVTAVAEGKATITGSIEKLNSTKAGRNKIYK